MGSPGPATPLSALERLSEALKACEGGRARLRGVGCGWQRRSALTATCTIVHCTLPANVRRSGRGIRGANGCRARQLVALGTYGTYTSARVSESRIRPCGQMFTSVTCLEMAPRKHSPTVYVRRIRSQRLLLAEQRPHACLKNQRAQKRSSRRWFASRRFTFCRRRVRSPSVYFFLSCIQIVVIGKRTLPLWITR